MTTPNVQLESSLEKTLEKVFAKIVERVITRILTSPVTLGALSVKMGTVAPRVKLIARPLYAPWESIRLCLIGLVNDVSGVILGIRKGCRIPRAVENAHLVQIAPATAVLLQVQ